MELPISPINRQFLEEVLKPAYKRKTAQKEAVETALVGKRRDRIALELRCRWTKDKREGLEGQVWICPDCGCWTANPDKSMCAAKNRRKRGVVGRRFTDR